MYHQVLFLIPCLVLFSIFVLRYCREKPPTVENFTSIFKDPLGWIAGQGSEVWNFVEQPLAFVRDVAYNVYPNYTWVTRYYDKRNDSIRANKGLPPLTASPTDPSKVNFDFGVQNKINSYFLNKSSQPNSLVNKIF